MEGPGAAEPKPGDPKVGPLLPKVFPPLERDPKVLPPLLAKEAKPDVPTGAGEAAEPKTPLPVVLPNAGVLAVNVDVFPNPPKPIELPGVDGFALNGVGEFTPAGDPKLDDIGVVEETPN